MSPDVTLLIDWLGPEGAVAGLERGKHTNAELMILARELGVAIDKKAARKQIAIEIVTSGLTRIDRSREFLLQMSIDELKRYFSDRMVSSTEIHKLLKDLGISPTRTLRGKVEISDLGMYQRVAKGKT